MEWEKTQTQSDSDRRRSRDLSQPREQPPASVPGIELVQFLGEGAFGEVWIGLDGNTGRRIAVKFFAHRQDVDWTGMSGEVEKLVMLSNDRRIVQLLKVGWDTDPPYYVMEYLEAGSLHADIGERGPWPVDAAVELFTELAKALEHAHAKGVLHCDLKPANVLLDHDRRPRLCDFGQSRLARERKPALGTFFYMAPEQASLEAAADVRWDVYGLGAILHTCLTGHPPFWSEAAEREIAEGKDVAQRLQRYQAVLARTREPALDRRALGLDHRLATILERCLQFEPEKRFANIPAVLDAIKQRAAEQQRRPLVLLGGVAPLLLVLIMALFAWRGMRGAVDSAGIALTERVRKSNRFAAQFVAARVTSDLEKYFLVVEQRAGSGVLAEQVREAIGAWEEATTEARATFVKSPRRIPLQHQLDEWMSDPTLPQVASWFVCGPDGTQLAASFDRRTAPTLGDNFAWRTYFHGGREDLPVGEAADTHIKRTQLSALLKSTATQTWKVAVSSPIYDRQSNQFLGIVAVTFEIGHFISFFEQGNAEESRFAVLVDGRTGPYYGVILQHPLYSVWRRVGSRLPDDLSQLRVDLQKVRASEPTFYHDPMADHRSGRAFRRNWIVAEAAVQLPAHRGKSTVDSGLVVLVQEDHDTAVAPVVKLEHDMKREGLVALGLIFVTVLFAWYLVLGRLAVYAGNSRSTPGRRQAPSTR